MAATDLSLSVLIPNKRPTRVVKARPAKQTLGKRICHTRDELTFCDVSNLIRYDDEPSVSLPTPQTERRDAATVKTGMGKKESAEQY